MVLRKSMEPKALPRKGASRLPCGDQGLTGATSTRRRKRAILDKVSLSTDRGHHDGNAAAVGSTQQVEIS